MFKTVTVIGANGIMGANVAGMFASFGKAKVYMISRNLKDSEGACNRAATSVKSDTLHGRLIPKTYDDLATCVSESDLIFESVSEDINIKRMIYSQINSYLKPETIIATGTSGISINQLSKEIKQEYRKNFYGIHMFNPPYKMTLCELIPTESYDEKTLNKLRNYLSDNLHRTVVTIKDSPAFLGNRIGFYFINEAVQHAYKFRDKGGIDYIDSILGPFTGRQMAPLLTADFVGLDTHKAIVDNMKQNCVDKFSDSYELPTYIENLIDNNHLGKKVGKGLYQTVIGSEKGKKRFVYDIATNSFRTVAQYSFPFVEKMKKHIEVGNYTEANEVLLSDESKEAEICVHFLIRYVIYSLHISKELGGDFYVGDHAMATGFNWIPPLAVIAWFGGNNNFLGIVNNKMPSSYIDTHNIGELVTKAPESNYDYRPFLKAK